jgi:predicted phosphoribosyltransferase
MGAVASGGIVVRTLEGGYPGITDSFERVAAEERRELERREGVYRAALPPLALQGKTVVLVDDGLATGSTMLAAVRAARAGGATAIIVAAPVASPQAARLVGAEADELIVLQTPSMLFAIGEWYEHFEQLEDEEVCRLLELRRHDLAGPGASGHAVR